MNTHSERIAGYSTNEDTSRLASRSLNTGPFESGYFSRAYPDYNRQNPRRKLDFYKALIKGHYPGGRGSILDIGCGPGKFINSIPATWKRYAMDPSEEALNGRGATIEFARGSLPEIPFAGSFDVITAFDVLEHVADLCLSGRTIDAHLATRGIFVFVVPVYDGPLGKVVSILDKDATHIQKCGRNFWLTWAQTHFEVCSWTGVMRCLVCRRWYVHLVTRAGRFCTPAIAIVARKRAAEKK